MGWLRRLRGHTGVSSRPAWVPASCSLQPNPSAHAHCHPTPAQGKLEPERRAQLIEHGKALKEQLESLEGALVAVEEDLQREGQRLPNLTHPAAPIGGEEEAAVLKLVGGQRGGHGPRGRWYGD